jgi:hypothetical protein
MLGVAMAAAGEACALSRAMWAEFNAIYYLNLRPTAECNAYRARSLELLKDNSLSPEALDTRMHALWAEAKAGCLQAALPGRPVGERKEAVSAKAATPAAAVAPAASAAPPSGPAGRAAQAVVPAAPPVLLAEAAAVPELRTAATPSPAPAGAVQGGVEGERKASPAGRAHERAAQSHASEPRTEQPAPVVAGTATGVATFGPPRIALARPPIDLPSPADLRLEAACAKRNPYAYQVETPDDPCATLARGKAPQVAAAAGSGESPGSGGRGAFVLPVVAALGVLGAATTGWMVWRRRQRRTVVADVDAAPEGSDPGAPDGLPARAPA